MENLAISLVLSGIGDGSKGSTCDALVLNILDNVDKFGQPTGGSQLGSSHILLQEIGQNTETKLNNLTVGLFEQRDKLSDKVLFQKGFDSSFGLRSFFPNFRQAFQVILNLRRLYS